LFDVASSFKTLFFSFSFSFFVNMYNFNVYFSRYFRLIYFFTAVKVKLLKYKLYCVVISFLVTQFPVAHFYFFSTDFSFLAL